MEGRKKEEVEIRYQFVVGYWLSRDCFVKHPTADTSIVVRQLTHEPKEKNIHKALNALADVVQCSRERALRERAVIAILGVCISRPFTISEELFQRLLDGLCNYWDGDVYAALRLLYEHHVKRGQRRAFQACVQRKLRELESMRTRREEVRKFLLH